MGLVKAGLVRQSNQRRDALGFFCRNRMQFLLYYVIRLLKDGFPKKVALPSS